MVIPGNGGSVVTHGAILHDGPIHLGVPHAPGGMQWNRIKYTLWPLPSLAIRSKSSTLSNPDSRARSFVMSVRVIGVIESTTMWPSSIR
jgi:hypothetical protein